MASHIHPSSHGASWENTQIQGDTDTTLRDAVISGFDSVIAFGTWKTPPIADCKGTVIWDKGPASGMGDLRFPWKMSWEMIYVRGESFRNDHRDEGIVRGHIMPTWETSHRFHPHQKPVSLLKYLLARAVFAQVVLDPFMGSGTTLRAAKDLGRKAIGIEIEERYCEIAAKRMSQSVLNFA